MRVTVLAAAVLIGAAGGACANPACLDGDILENILPHQEAQGFSPEFVGRHLDENQRLHDVILFVHPNGTWMMVFSDNETGCMQSVIAGAKGSMIAE